MRINAFIIVMSMAVVFLSQDKLYAGEQEYLIDQDRSTVEFNFRSTLHGVQGRAKKFSGLIVADMRDSISVKRGNIVFDAASIDTEEPKRDENMRKMFQVDQFASITFDILDALSDKDGGMLIHGLLAIRNVRLPVDVHAEVQKIDEGYILSGEVPLSLKDFSLRPPSVLMFIRVFDRVNVRFKMFLKENV